MRIEWEYRGEGIYLFWSNPFNEGRKEDICMLLWPCHAPEKTKTIEDLMEGMASEFCQAWNSRSRLGDGTICEEAYNGSD